MTMPGNLLERPKMTRVMYQSLKLHIMREREKIKQEQAVDEAQEQKRKEEELRRKKQEEDNLTLEQTKEQITELQKKLEALKEEKHELFSQLKKVLHQEDENKKKQQQREQSELMALPQQYGSGMNMGGHALYMQAGMIPTATKYMSLQRAPLHNMKRTRSPSPPPTNAVYAGAPYPGGGGKYPSTSQHQKQGPYSAQSTHVTYSSQSGVQAAAGQSQAGGKYPAGQSAFSTYAYQSAKNIPERGYAPGSYAVQRVNQPAFLNSPHSGNNLQQQLEHANQKSGFTEEKFKIQSQQSARGGAASQPSAVVQPPPGGASSNPPKGGIMSGFPVRTSQASAAYQSPASKPGAHSSPQATPRSLYQQQQQFGRY